jgi:CRP/FNR family transcriptional regulator
MQCDNYLMVASGRIRVQQVSESGREIVLYRIGDGESCVLTTACLLAHERYSAEAITETEVSALVVPRISFERLVAESQRLLELTDRVDSLSLTHHELSVELGTAREVISRQLKEFERRGWIRLERGRIVIRDRGAVSNLAGLRQL